MRPPCRSSSHPSDVLGGQVQQDIGDAAAPVIEPAAQAEGDLAAPAIEKLVHAEEMPPRRSSSRPRLQEGEAAVPVIEYPSDILGGKIPLASPRATKYTVASRS